MAHDVFDSSKGRDSKADNLMEEMSKPTPETLSAITLIQGSSLQYQSY